MANRGFRLRYDLVWLTSISTTICRAIFSSRYEHLRFVCERRSPDAPALPSPSRLRPASEPPPRRRAPSGQLLRLDSRVLPWSSVLDESGR